MGGRTCEEQAIKPDIYDGAYVYQYTALDKGAAYQLNYRLEYTEQNVCATEQCFFDNGDNDPTNDCYEPGSCLAGCDSAGANCLLPQYTNTKCLLGNWVNSCPDGFIQNQCGELCDQQVPQLEGESWCDATYPPPQDWYNESSIKPQCSNDCKFVGLAGKPPRYATQGESCGGYCGDNAVQAKAGEQCDQGRDPAPLKRTEAHGSGGVSKSSQYMCTGAIGGKPLVRNGSDCDVVAGWDTAYFICSTGAPAPVPPLVTLNVSPTPINSGASAILSWSSTNAATCTASWSSTPGVSGTLTVSPTTTTTYTLSCSGSGGSTPASARLTVNPAPAVTLFVQPPTPINSGDSATLNWSSSDATTCTASGGWTGTKAISGTLSVSPITTTTYTLSCSGSAPETVTVTVNPPPKPSAPSGLTAEAVLGARIDLTWTDNSNNETGFKIERKEGAGGTYTEIATASAGVITYQDAGLSPYTLYYYQVRATNAGGDSVYTSPASATTGAPPVAPSGLTASSPAGYLQITLLWTDNSSDEDGFTIERSQTGSEGPYTEIATPAAHTGTGTMSYADIGLSAETHYWYRVSAHKGAEDYGTTNVVTATTGLAPEVPNVPYGLTATVVSSAQINLTWSYDLCASPCVTNPIGYKVERIPGSPTVYPVYGKSHDHVNLNADTNYKYRVLAYNGAGESAYTAQIQAKTWHEATKKPETPTGLTATVQSDTRITLSWQDNSIDETDGEIGYKIVKRAGVAGDGGTYAAHVGSVDAWANAESFYSTSLSPVTSYCYEVYATNAKGDSAYSNEACAITNPAPGTPAPPSNLTATAVSSTRINLTWTDNSSDEAGFNIERKKATDVNFVSMSSVTGHTSTIGTINYSDTGIIPGFALSPGTAYDYRVLAYNGLLKSSYTDTASATTTVALNDKSLTPDLLAYGESMIKAAYQWTKNEINLIADKVRGSSIWENLAQLATHRAIAKLPEPNGIAGGWVKNYGDGGLVSDGGFKVGYKFKVDKSGS
ncbi:MAG: fibronectin type III domain-containing protein, partial [Candidatus Parcubacteria bacterium]|nr:fibronectin type III domain-containing protein [Candidatus Parcubacteria bacterium]